MSSPESPVGLRRRGAGSFSDASALGGHTRNPSDGFGSFVDASPLSAFDEVEKAAGPSCQRTEPPATFDPGLAEPLDAPRSANRSPTPASAQQPSTSQSTTLADTPAAAQQSAQALAEDEWETGDLAQQFSPVSPRFSPVSPRFPVARPRPGPKRTASSSSRNKEWSDWDSFLASHTSQLPSAGSTEAPKGGIADPSSHNPADDAFFDAFEMAAKQQEEAQRVPSPPIIDLREVERKLDLKREASLKPGPGSLPEPAEARPEDEDFFAAFERAPEQALGRANTLQLEPSQLEDIHDARTSPMQIASDARRDYFPSTATPMATTSGPQQISQPQHTRTQQAAQAQRFATSPTESTSPSSWTGSLRKTWTSLRGLSGDLVSHLPSAADFIVPPEEGESRHDDEDQKAPGQGGLLLASEDRRGSGTSSASNHRPSVEHRRSPIPPMGAGGSGSAAPMRARDLFASPQPSSNQNTLRRAPSHAASMPIAGAPGFDASNTRKWNTGHWTLEPEKSKRAIAVTLSDRSKDTESVCDPWHAARIQAALPPRLQLGRQWKLLYSLDQHGMSLATLYHRVAQGLDPSKARKVSSGVREAEGWLRGASSATKAAMGVTGSDDLSQSRIKHVGGGLAIQDAGLVIAIRDDNDNVFGAFVNERLRPQQHYYGSGECFLWKTVRRSKAERDAIAREQASSVGNGNGGTEAEAEREDPKRTIETFRWTGKNDYMVLTESDFLSVGGGNGKFGLWIDGALERGVSTRCPAFDNEVLCNSKPKGDGSASADEGEGRFECIGLEVWAVGTD